MSAIRVVNAGPKALQRGFLTAAQVPYLLLAIAVVAALYLWTALQGKTEELAELEAAKDKAVAALEQQLGKTLGDYKTLSSAHDTLQAEHSTLQEETIPALKLEASFARAENQRAQNVFYARDNLVAQLSDANQINAALNAELMESADQLPLMKKNLSMANAENMRLRHISQARDNLMAQLKQAKQASVPSAESMAAQEMQDQQATQLASVKKMLSFANAENMRLRHISNARDNLMAQAKHVDHVHAGRLKALESVRDIEVSALTDTIKAKTIEMSQLESKYRDLSRDASAARAQVQRNRHLASARDNLMNQISDMKKTNEDLTAQVQSLPDLKFQLSAANAENMRLRHISDARDRLMSQLNATK